MRETDLYPPVRDYLLAQGYTVRSEVRGCDIAATRDGDLLVIELKRQLSVDLLTQAVERQRATPSVYVALPDPRPAGRVARTRWRGVQRLLRRLELGLILVSLGGRAPGVRVVFHPLPFDQKRSRRHKRAILQEIAARPDDHNQGGSSQRKLVTAYRESAIHIACCLERLGPAAPRRLRELGTGAKTLGILSRNVYGWFERVDRAVYALTAQGRAGLEEFPDVAERYRAALGEAASPPDA